MTTSPCLTCTHDWHAGRGCDCSSSCAAWRAYREEGMDITLDLMDMITAHEGLEFRVYRDSKGIKTIGVGRNLEGNPLTAEEELAVGATTDELMRGMATLTREQAQYLLKNDLQEIVAALKGKPWFDCLTPNRKQAMIDMAMMGPAKLDAFRETHAHILAGEWKDVARHILASKWAQDVKERRAMEVALMMAYDLPWMVAAHRYHNREFGGLSWARRR